MGPSLELEAGISVLNSVASRQRTRTDVREAAQHPLFSLILLLTCHLPISIAYTTVDPSCGPETVCYIALLRLHH